MNAPVPTTAFEPAELTLSVPGMRCAGCIGKVEDRLKDMPGVRDARVNLTQKRVRIEGVDLDPLQAIGALKSIGFDAHEMGDVEDRDVDRSSYERGLLIRLGVSGFAMMNVMLLSVAVWSGAGGATRDLFHWISAAIALPVVAYAAQPFFVSAWSALRVRTLNMDVPISLAIALAAAMSLYETTLGGHHAYFDAALSLTFFLLGGRYLDHRTRSAARSAAADLAALEVQRITRLTAEGETLVRPMDLFPGDRILVRAGERIPVDGDIAMGHANVDRSLITGETRPVPVQPGAQVAAGEINLDGRLEIIASEVGEDTTLRRIARMVEMAEGARDSYTALADKAARIYAPVVHLLAAIAFVGWVLATGDIRVSANIAIAVLIITCPCALGLAVPAVVTAATGALFRNGVLVRHATGLERLGNIDTVVFDKTGTLTNGAADLTGIELGSDEAAALATLARSSRHPAAKAVAEALADGAALPLTGVREIPGHGVEGFWNGQRLRLGKADWVGHPGDGLAANTGHQTFPIKIHERLRDGARDCVAWMKENDIEMVLLTGDGPDAAQKVARELQIDAFESGLLPEDKVARINALRASGRNVLMVGDGLNDTAALASADASIAPGTALDASRLAADVVLIRNSLADIPVAIRLARNTRRRIKENFAIAAGYNMIAIPLALAGFATPLMAALAMSSSSITVTLNALRVTR